MITRVQLNNSRQPDVIVDLTFTLREKCDLHRIARSLELGFFSVETTGCVFTMDAGTPKVIFAPAIKFPRYAPITAMISFTGAIQPNVTNAILFMIGNQSREFHFSPWRSSV